MDKFVKTNKGTELPLLNLKGKSYLQVAHRLIWFIEENKNYRIETEVPVLTGEYATAKVTIKVYDEAGNLTRMSQDWKSESSKHFGDFMEKAITGALGRALAQLGHGTAYALADLDEGERIVDAPQEKVISIDKAKKTSVGSSGVATSTITTGSFNQDKKAEDEGGW